MAVYRFILTFLFFSMLANASNAFAAPQINQPSAGSTLSGSSQAFTWSLNAAEDNDVEGNDVEEVDQWWLYVGTSVGARDIADSGDLGLNTEYNVIGMPTDGSTVHARLWYFSSARWNYVDSSYIAATINAEATTPAMISPANGNELAGAKVNFQWRDNNTPVNYWWLYLGSVKGGNDIYDSGRSIRDQTSVTVDQLPVDGSTAYARLWFRTTADGWQYADTTYLTNTNDDVGDGMVNFTDRGLIDTRGLKAFPGAEGGGQNANGGRGGQLVIVNTTDCSDQAGDGKVSWKEAWQGSGDVSPGDRTIVFSVGGLFDCGRNTNNALIRAEGEMTVACQTAPSPGVNIAAYRVEYKAEQNVIIRGCQFLNHDISGDTASMLRVVTTGSSRDIIVDRVTGLHGPDDFTMAFITSNNTTDTMANITLSNSIIAEGDAYSTHSESTPATGNENRYQHSHGPGCSVGLNVGNRKAITNCSFIGNLMAHNNRRNPKFWHSSGHVIGNMGYNIGETGVMVLQRTAPEIDVWVTDNFFKYGPNTKNNVIGNGYVINTNNNGTDRVRMERNTYQLKDNGDIIAIPDRLDNPNIEPMTFQPTRDWTDPSAFDCLGVKHRDANVDRIIREVIDATGEIGIGTFGNPRLNDGDAGRHWLASEGGDPDYYPQTSHPAGYDTDNDGMADEWEEANGLIVGTQDHNEDIDGDGYTNIEEFVNSLLRCNGD